MGSKDTGCYLQPAYGTQLEEHQRREREIDFLRERLTRNADGGVSHADDRIRSISSNQTEGQSLVSQYRLASFNTPHGKSVDHTSGSDVQSVQTIPRCHISFENTAIRDEAEVFSQRHQTDHPTLDTAVNWQKQLTRASILARLYDVEQGKPVQHLCHVDRANDPPITTSDGLSKLGTEVRDMESKLSGILFIVSRFGCLVVLLTSS